MSKPPPRRPTGAALPGPWKFFKAWNDLALSTGEMLAASAQVISHRTRRLHAAGPLPNARDRREFALMGREKLQAAQASSQAMARELAASPLDAGVRAWQDWMGVAQAALALGTSRSLAEAFEQQSQLVQSATRAAASLGQAGEVGARLAQQGLGPIHAAATANARRLGRHRTPGRR